MKKNESKGTRAGTKTNTVQTGIVKKNPNSGGKKK